jgi:hypothetical protein
MLSVEKAWGRLLLFLCPGWREQQESLYSEDLNAVVAVAK